MEFECVFVCLVGMCVMPMCVQMYARLEICMDDGVQVDCGW